METKNIIIIKSEKNNKLTKPILESNDCIICFEPVNQDYFVNCKTCKNYYCYSCLQEWKAKSKSNLCTYCQQPTLKTRKNYFNILKKCFISFFN